MEKRDTDVEGAGETMGDAGCVESRPVRGEPERVLGGGSVAPWWVIPTASGRLR